ncbi:MAG: YqgE/AlgH family protein [Glaciecola sp.]
MTEISSLQDHFLIAMPSLSDKYFSRSVTYILEHSHEGAMGLIINQPSTMTFRELIEQTDDGIEVDTTISEKLILCGGPVHPDRGFVLHSHQDGWKSSLPVSDTVMVTTSKDILTAMSQSKGPDSTIVTLGYAAWEAGQLEQELQDNAWLTIPACNDIMFTTPIYKKWEEAVNKLGVDVWQLTQQAGEA